MSQDKFPIWSQWRFQAPDGSTGRVYLARREAGLEVWHYEYRNADGGGAVMDWAPSRRLAVELCSLCFRTSTRPRFVRVEDVNEEGMRP